jgi:GTP-binding protein HflX
MTLIDQTPKTPKAVLVGIKLSGQGDSEVQSSLDELERLVTTLGYDVIGRLWQKRSSTKTSTVLGDGKLKELATWTGGSGEVGPFFEKKKTKAALKWEKQAQEQDLSSMYETDEIETDEIETDEILDEAEESLTDQSTTIAPNETAEFVIFDCELSPNQLKSIEQATSATAIDRTGVIIEIFSRHAKSRAARLQVEIARLTYLAPRLRETSGKDDRGSAGGIGGKGAGESSLELDRRAIRDRIKALKDEFSAIDQEHDVRRARRSQENTVALVGYTNAGKSSLMRALTGSDVYVADKLFATLDTTVRILHPETHPRILVSDTVGFIKKLPHDLIASFRSTLDEAKNANLLLFVVDCADPAFRDQLKVTEEVLKELGVGDVPRLLILNKVDRVTEREQMHLSREFPEGIFMSALDQTHIESLRTRLIGYFESLMSQETILIPYGSQGILGEIREKSKVLNEEYTPEGVALRILAAPDFIRKLQMKSREWT